MAQGEESEGEEMSGDGYYMFTNTNTMSHSGLSMTAEEWRDYFKWEDEMKATYGSRFQTGEACFLRNPFKKREW